MAIKRSRTRYADFKSARALDRVYNKAENDYVRQGTNMTREQADRRIQAPRVAMRTNPISEYNNPHVKVMKNPRTGKDVRPVYYSGKQALWNAAKRSRSRTALQKRVNDVTGVTEFSHKSVLARATRISDAVYTFAKAGLFDQPSGGSTTNS